MVFMTTRENPAVDKNRTQMSNDLGSWLFQRHAVCATERNANGSLLKKSGHLNSASCEISVPTGRVASCLRRLHSADHSASNRESVLNLTFQ